MRAAPPRTLREQHRTFGGNSHVCFDPAHLRIQIARRAAFALVLGIFLLAPRAFGQASSSSDAVGTVTDASGATVPGATIHIINNSTAAERLATTNNSGAWSIPNIPPANYRVRVEKQGFKTSEIALSKSRSAKQ